MITFVYGAPGSGKTHYVFEKLKENSVSSFLVVPEQQTVIAERLALDTLDASSQLDFEVLNFTRLCNRVFRKHGGLSYRYINSTVKSLFMWRTLRELSPMLNEYGSAGNEISTTNVMINASDELTSCGISSAMLENAASKLPDGVLKSKLMDISLIDAAYKNLIAESYDDKSLDLAKLNSLLKTYTFFNGCNVYIDSFTSFTSPEYSIIEQIFRQADNVTVTLGCESPECGLICCESICDTAKKLIELADHCKKKHEKIFLTENFRAQNPELRAMTTELWESRRNNKASDIISESNRNNVKVLRCHDPYDEATAVVSLIEKEIRRGLKYSEIAVVARDASKYDGIIDTALENANIPYFMSKRTDISSTPTVALILTALRIKYLGFRSEDVLSHLKTGLCGFTPRDIDMFSEYIHTWSISGKHFEDDGWSMNPDGYVSEISERGKRILSAANKVREGLMSQLSRFFTELDIAENASDMCRAVYNYITDICLSDKLKEASSQELERGNRRAAADTLAIWNSLIGMLDDIHTSLSDEKLSVEDFYRAFLICVKGSSTGAIPTAYDEVTIGSASLIRTSNIRCTIIIGLNEGEFPAKINETGIFTDADRTSLAGLGVQLSSNSMNRSAEELLYARRAITLPSEKLYMLYTSTGTDGSLLRPSIIINRTLGLLDYLKSEDFAINEPLDAIWNLSSAEEHISELTMPYSAAVAAELDLHGRPSKLKEAIKSECSVSEETAKKIFGDRMQLSQTGINDFVNCRFGYYCKKVLALRENKKAEVDYRISGTFIHAVLEKFMKRLVTENGIELSDSEKLVDEVISELIGEICTEEQKASNRLRHLFLRLRRISILLIRSLTQEFENSEFRPEYFEYSIGDKDSDPLVFDLKDGSKVSLRGKIDRVDLWKHNGQIYVHVVDYKTGDKKFSLDDISSGLNLQLVIYLFTLCRAGTSFAKKIGCKPDESPVPAAATYLSSYVEPQKHTRLPDEKTVFDAAVNGFDRSGFFLDNKTVLNALDSRSHPKQGLLDENGIQQLRDDLQRVIVGIAEEMRSGIINAEPKSDGKSPCNYCNMAQICRNAKKDKY